MAEALGGAKASVQFVGPRRIVEDVVGAMIERNRFLTILSHLVLVLGVLVVAFPLYVTFVASTHTMADVVRVPMPLTPGSHFLENYRIALLGQRGAARRPPRARGDRVHDRRALPDFRR